jgi:chromosome segregation ATPase
VKVLELIFSSIAILLVTLVGSYIYYQRINQAQGEYNEAKSTVRSLTLGFSNQLKKISKNMNEIQKIASEAKFIAIEAEKTGQQALTTVKNDGLEAEKILKHINSTEEALASIQEEVNKLKKIRTIQPKKIDVEAPIPLKEEAVFDNLTSTEFNVLVIIEKLEEGTGPEIRDKIGKTREHTARLLKKLFEKGFIDRNTSSMPYRYYIRKEIRDLVKQKNEPVTT